jgi:hypothetical protein
VLRCLDFVEQAAFPATPPAAPAADGAAKPDLPTAQETEDWLRAFGDVERDPALRKYLHQDDFDGA